MLPLLPRRWPVCARSPRARPRGRSATPTARARHAAARRLGPGAKGSRRTPREEPYRAAGCADTMSRALHGGRLCGRNAAQRVFSVAQPTMLATPCQAIPGLALTHADVRDRAAMRRNPFAVRNPQTPPQDSAAGQCAHVCQLVWARSLTPRWPPSGSDLPASSASALSSAGDAGAPSYHDASIAGNTHRLSP